MENDENKDIQEQLINIRIKAISSNKEISSSFPLDTTISSIKDYIQLHHSEAFAKDRQRLFHNGKELEDKMTIKGIFSNKLIPVEVIFILFLSKAGKKVNVADNNTLLVCLHVFDYKQQVKELNTPAKKLYYQFLIYREGSEVLKRIPLRDENFKKLMKDYAEENELFDSEELMKQKVLNEFPGYGELFKPFWIYWMFGITLGLDIGNGGIRLLIFAVVVVIYYW